MVAELTALRDQIDEVDKALLNLLAKRLELVAEVGEVKSRFGLPIYVPEREASMLASRRAEAEALGVFGKKNAWQRGGTVAFYQRSR